MYFTLIFHIIIIGTKITQIIIHFSKISFLFIFYDIRNQNYNMNVHKHTTATPADPGFPVGGGVHPLGGVWTSDAGAFW